MNIQYIATAIRWTDRTYGNTYHSVRITRKEDKATIECPMEYGYGDQYRYTAREAMAKAGWIPETDSFQWEMDNDYPIHWGVSDSTKKDCLRNGGE